MINLRDVFKCRCVIKRLATCFLYEMKGFQMICPRLLMNYNDCLLFVKLRRKISKYMKYEKTWES